MVSVSSDNAANSRKAPPALNLPLDQLAFIIVKAREYDVKEADSDPDDSSNPADDGQTDVLTDEGDDPVREELLGAIRSLNVSNACAVALAVTHMKLAGEKR